MKKVLIIIVAFLIVAIIGGLQGYLWGLILSPPESFVASFFGGLIIGAVGICRAVFYVLR